MANYGQTVNTRASCAGGGELESRPSKSNTALQTGRHRFNINVSGWVALALRREDGHCKLIHASA